MDRLSGSMLGHFIIERYVCIDLVERGNIMTSNPSKYA
jgi:hypothetical protein